MALLTGLTLCFGSAAIASAAAPAGPGSTFITTYLDLPEGAIAGGASGSSEGEPAGGSVSGDGRYVAFPSDANTLVPGAHPDVGNIVRKDRSTGEVLLVSRATGADGAGPAKNSYKPVISADGNLVGFLTRAKLDPADVDDEDDVYVRNISAGTTTLATPGTTTQTSGFDLSADGNYIAFATSDSLTALDLNGAKDIYRRNLNNGSTALASRVTATVTPANAPSSEPTISGDGRWVGFSSNATNLTGGFVNNNGGSSDVFVRDMNTNSNYLVSARWNNSFNGADGQGGEPTIAGTPGSLSEVRVAYTSYATDVADAAVIDPSTAASVYLKTFPVTASALISRATGVAGANANSRAHTPSISDDGNLITFASDATNLGAGADYYGVYLRNVTAATTTLTSAKNEYAVQAAIAGNGSFAAWVESGATPDSDPQVYEIFGRTLPGGPVQFVSRPPGSNPYLVPAATVKFSELRSREISADGRYVVFASYSPFLPDTDPAEPAPHVYRRDLVTGETKLVSRASGAGGGPADVYSFQPTISSDGNRVGFTSFGKLDPADTDLTSDVYVRDVAANTTMLASRADGAAGASADQACGAPSISGDGSRIAFETTATNLGAAGGKVQVYVRDLDAGKTTLASRANGVAGAIGDGDSRHPQLSDDGGRVAFDSRSTNLDPDDPDTLTDIYVRDLSTDTLQLASRRAGLAGLKSDNFSTSAVISGDGDVVAFESYDQLMAPEAGAWPPMMRQVVSRNLETGANTLVSRAPGGPAAETGADSPSANEDGSVIAFNSDATNLIAGLGGTVRRALFVRQMGTGALVGPPAFGLVDNKPQQGARSPSISGNGQCLAFTANGHNEASGDFSDVSAGYVYVVSGTCSDPRAEVPAVAPVLSKVSLKPKKFAVGKKKTAKVAKKKKSKKGKKGKHKSHKGTKIRFTLNTGADLTIRFEKKTKGRKAGGKCRKKTKKNRRKKKCVRFVKKGKLKRNGQAAGGRVVPFSGRVGKKKLKPGKYRAVLVATNEAGKSKPVRRGFKVIRR